MLEPNTTIKHSLPQAQNKLRCIAPNMSLIIKIQTNMTDTDFIKKFANSKEIEKNRYSCLIIALQDARKITGRDMKNGNITNDILENDHSFLDPYSFIGVVNYLLILELIGEIFRLKSFTTNKKNNIYKTLKQFSYSLDDKDIDTIIALRNSLAHNYGLINIPHKQNEYITKLHKFTLINTRNANLIKFPLQNWNLDYSDKSDETSTQISVIKLQDLIETVYKNLTTEIDNNAVELALKKGIDELKARFTIRY
ncbi:hypothetical protein DMA11_18885 [Marinilabiliaceae bacterium JC017]|nr:hypothetical protein DMA11_18885 [Marinilabiliaceae bacterium JC017]